MDDRVVDRVWNTQLLPWLKSKEVERSRAARRFYLIALPGLAAGIVLGWLALNYTADIRLTLLAGFGSALGFAWLGYSPLHSMQVDYRHQILAKVGEAFGMQYAPKAPGNFPVERFHEHDLITAAPGGLEHAFHGKMGGRHFDVARAEFEFNRADLDSLQRRYTDFSGILIRIELKNSPLGEVVLTREMDWFSMLSRTGTSFAAGRLKLFDLGSGDVGGPFKAFCESTRIAEAVIKPDLMEGLTTLESSFGRRPLRLAIAPVDRGGVCYVAIETSGVFEAFSILEGLEQRARYNGLVKEIAAITKLVELIVQETDGVEARGTERHDSFVETTS
jgi:hypothetical protein